MSSPAEAKQMEPEGKPTSQVRLEWKENRAREDSYICRAADGVLMHVHRLYNTDTPWVGTLIFDPGLSRAFATREEAQLWCEAKLTELLEKDLKSLGGGVQAEPAEVTP